MTYPDTFERKIGFDAVRVAVAAHCASVPGKESAADEIVFSTDFNFITERLTETSEMDHILSDDNALSFGALRNVGEILTPARAIGTFITAEGFVGLRSTLQTIEDTTTFFSSRRDENGRSPYPILDTKAATIPSFRQIISTIDRTVDRFAEVKDSASPELAEIRRSLRQTTASLGSIMKRVIGRAIDNGYLEADSTSVVRNGRLVLPVSPMHKRKINGIVHDESASGKTVFIEPAELVEANNRIRELQMEEKRETAKILRELTDIVRPQFDDILQAVAIAGHFDFVRAKALYARQVGGMMPHISDKRELEWYHAIHPVLLLSLQRHGKEIVPLDITLTDKQRILVISGPNAGGKSVCLKTVGIVQYMMQCGLLPTVYENSHFGIFDNIFINIGDDQSIEDDLSTYSSHLRDMKFFLHRGNASTLLLVDEFGGGTEPQIGGAIAQAILKEFNNKKMWGIVTTHFQNLKQFAEDTPGLVNGSMLYDRHLMRPTFKLSIGNPGSSFAIEIARKTGLPKAIIDDAEEIVGSDYVNLDRYLLDIARDRKYWSNKRDQIKQKEKKVDAVLSRYEEEAETLRQKRREILSEAKESARKIIEESNASVERTIREIRQTQADKEKTRAARLKLNEERQRLSDNLTKDDSDHPLLKKAPKSKKKTAKPKPLSPERPFAPGDHVKLEGQSTVGTIIEVEGKNAIVNFGLLKTNVALSRLTHTIAKPQSGAKTGTSFVSDSTLADSRNRQLNFKQEIDVRGMRVDEAVQAVTYFIDDAIQFNAGRIRILHGTGTGALRQSIRQYLAHTPGVRSFHDEDVRFGGAGITVVELE